MLHLNPTITFPAYRPYTPSTSTSAPLIAAPTGTTGTDDLVAAWTVPLSRLQSMICTHAVLLDPPVVPLPRLPASQWSMMCSLLNVLKPHTIILKTIPLGMRGSDPQPTLPRITTVLGNKILIKFPAKLHRDPLRRAVYFKVSFTTLWHYSGV